VRAVAGWGAFLLAYLFLYAPLLTIAVFALNDSTVQALPWSGFTLHWFTGISENNQLLSSLTFGLTVSSLVVTISRWPSRSVTPAFHSACGRSFWAS
jgi:ABC-type spermidine/putrescine transport system permease subunit II